MNVTNQNKLEFFSRGWTIIEMGFYKEEIKKYYESTLALKNKAYLINYPLQRCYFPHLFHKNIAAIESPFNKLILNSGVEELFQRLQIGKTLNNLLGWEKSYLHLARLFTMENYKYRGDWHRDFFDWDGRLNNIVSIQMAIYLKNQDGFRIFKHNLDTKVQKKITDPISSPLLPARIDKYFYDEIKGREGTILFFAPSILHQGNSSTNRLDFHLRFSRNPLNNEKIKMNNLPVNDYFVPDFYQKNFEIKNDKFSPRIRKPNLKEKILNSLNYYSGARNFFYTFKFLSNNSLARKSFPNNWSFDIFSNTIFQKS